MTTELAWLVFSQHGEYSDETFVPLAIARTEKDARAACEKFARDFFDEKEPSADAGVCPTLVRPTIAGDSRHGPGWWVVVHAWGFDVPADDEAYTFGLQSLELVPSRATEST